MSCNELILKFMGKKNTYQEEPKRFLKRTKEGFFPNKKTNKTKSLMLTEEEKQIL